MLNVKGASDRLHCSKVWIHKLVSKGQLRAYAYVDGVLMEYAPGSSQGTPLSFREEDIDTFQKRPVGHPVTTPAVPKPPKKPTGRPRKVIDTTEPRRPVGRPKKAVESNEATSRPVGRPQKSFDLQ